MAINQWLAEVYGTDNSGAGDDLEKTAQAMLLEKLAEQEGIDLSGLDENQLDALAQQIIADSQEGGEEAPTADEEEAQAKFAEADFLGRVMAHSYTQELNKIAEEAAKAEEGEKKVPPQIAAAVANAEKKEEKKEEKEEAAEKSAGILAAAIEKLGGTVGTEEQQLEEYVEKRAEEMAAGWLRENGYIK